MKYDIVCDNTLYAVYPEIRLGCIRFTAEVKPSGEELLNHLDNEVAPRVRAGIDGKAWDEIIGIKGSRAAYKAFGRNPGRYRVSSEALLRRVKRGDELYHINTVVDVNNIISIESGLSVGSYDLDHIDGPITLKRAGEGEGYQGIGKDFIDMENMLVLCDETGIFGSSMSDSTRAMVTEDTINVLVVIYCFEDDIDLEALLKHAVDTFAVYAGVTDAEYWIA